MSFLDSESSDSPFIKKERVPEKTKADLIKDPIRCPLCLKSLMCPRSKDPDDYVDRVLSHCLKGNDPICKKQAANPANQVFIANLFKRVAND